MLLDLSNTSITFLANSKYTKFLKTTKARAVVVHANFNLDTELKSKLLSFPWLSSYQLTMSTLLQGFHILI